MADRKLAPVFDPNQDGRVSKQEQREGYKKLKWKPEPGMRF